MGNHCRSGPADIWADYIKKPNKPFLHVAVMFMYILMSFIFQEKNDASLGTADTNFQDGLIAEGGIEDNAERMPSANEEINEQDMGMHGLI